MKVIKSDKQKYVENTRDFLLEKAEEGFDRVVVVGFKDEHIHWSASATGNFAEDVGSMMIAIIDRVNSNASTKG